MNLFYSVVTRSNIMERTSFINYQDNILSARVHVKARNLGSIRETFNFPDPKGLSVLIVKYSGGPSQRCDLF